MADKTPVKTLPGRERVCRCCNSDVKSNPIDLFGEKAKAEKLLSNLEIITGLTFVAGDELPTYICRNCFNYTGHDLRTGFQRKLSCKPLTGLTRLTD